MLIPLIAWMQVPDPGEMAKFVLERKTEVFNTLAAACMLWWVSSVGFFGGVFYFFSQANHLKPGQRASLSVAAVLFGLSTVVFGLTIILCYLSPLQTEINQFATGSAPGFFDTELRMFRLGMWIGTFNFAVFTLYFMPQAWRAWKLRKADSPTGAEPTHPAP